MEYFFVEEAGNGNTILLTDEEHQHCTKVKRHKTGDLIDVVNGKGLVFKTKIISILKSETLLEILEIEEHQNLSTPIIIGISPTKNPSRLEWFVEKATEIGVSKIFIISCDRSDKKGIKMERLKKITISALKQSGRLWLPELQFFTSFTQLPWRTSLVTYQKFIAYCETNELHLKDVAKRNEPVFLAIGPEGDFTGKEVEFAMQQACIPVSLGNNRLRTETAGLFALSCLVCL